MPAHAEKVLEISWTPTCDGGWRDTITLEDHRKIKRDIPLIFKSCSPKVSDLEIIPTKNIIYLYCKINKYYN